MQNKEKLDALLGKMKVLSRLKENVSYRELTGEVNDIDRLKDV